MSYNLGVEYWSSGLPFPSLGNFPNSGIKSTSATFPALQVVLYCWVIGEAPIPSYLLKKNRIISVHFQGKSLNIIVIQVYAPTRNAEEAELEQFYEDLQDLLELTLKKDVLFIIGDWNAKVRNQDIPGVTGKFGLGVQNEAGQRLTEFCQENVLVIANTLFWQYKRRLHMDITRWSTPKSD